ncbi:uncharacterized protein PAC_07966 [Phialocephala subalpina]|uniref:Uncharacterized protein n=1 Tax=Phialocephala subalpina TaxID=576137 RepID=A0A1L7WZ71_9HELO|nr:uncharacterized protein PAC_07966 [Phialocephala subalpina]
MGKRKAKQPKPKKPSKKESKKAATKEGLSQTSVQASSSPLTENSSNHCSMPCGCPDGNASAKQVAFVVAEDRALPPGQQPETSTDTSTICRLPAVFGIYRGVGSDLFIRLSRKDTSLFFLSLKYATYDPTPSVTLSRPRNQVAGENTIETSPIATATVPKPPHTKHPDVDIRLYSPDSPVHDSSNLQETLVTSSTDVRYSSRNFEYQIPGYETKERFAWRHHDGPEVRSLKGRKYGMKLVRVQTGAVVGAWTKPRSTLSDTKQGKIAFFDRSLGPQFEFLAIVSLITHKVAQKVSALSTYDPESQYNGSGGFGNTGCTDSRYALWGFGSSACLGGHYGPSGFGNSSLFGNSGLGHTNQRRPSFFIKPMLNAYI